jgi:DNA mismatch repair protein MutS
MDADYTPLIRLYFQSLDESIKKHGDRVCLLYQVGSFYENYGYDNINHTEEIGKLLNIMVTRKNKKIPPSATNPKLFGFQIDSLHKFVPLLIANNYTVVIYDQTLEDKQIRKLSHVYTQSTYIEGPIDNIQLNGFVCATLFQNHNIFTLGFTFIEILTGEIKCIELYSKDNNYIKDELFHYIETFHPKEILLYTDINIDVIEKYKITIKNEIPQCFRSIQYQNELLNKIYDCGMLSPIEFIDLERHPDAVICLCLAIQYIHEYNSYLLNNIKIPTILNTNCYLNLTNDTIYQLDLISNKSQTSLFDIINNTVTHMGARLLRQRLLQPTIDADELNKRYNYIEILIPCYKNVQMHLKNVYDLHRIFRRLAINNIRPYDFCLINSSINSLTDANKHVPFNVPDYVTNMILLLRQFIDKTFNLSIIEESRTNALNTEIFKRGVSDDIDKIKDENINFDKKLNDICDYLNKTYYDNIKKPSKKNSVKFVYNKSVVSINSNKGETWIQTTVSRWNIIKNALPDDVKFNVKINTTTAIITNDEIDKISESLHSNNKVKKLLNEYLSLCAALYSQIFNLIEPFIQFISEVDVYCSLAQVAIHNHYVRPVISDNVRFDAKTLRHPIVEVIRKNEQYVANDYIADKGMLLFGVNGCGKSIFLKSVGLIIILAQMGSYVPADSFTFTPFTKIISRVTYDDNMYKNMSSFVVEMTELRNILRYADSTTLVLGDEVCKGTETTSAISIVSATVELLCNKMVPFIFTTHLHDIAELPRIKKLDIYIRHLGIQFDFNNIIYERKLKDGNGPTTYGIEVCKYLDLGDAFINSCVDIKHSLTGDSTDLIANKKSRYNSKIYVDKCSLCGKKNTLETHHLKEQHTADDLGFINTDDGIIHKNDEFNLIVLCAKCHDIIHSTQNINKKITKKATARGIKVRVPE